MSPTETLNDASRDRASSGDLYRAVWRWHFYAGLFVVPFLLILAITGALYLFHHEIEDYWYRDLRHVQATQAMPQSPQALAAAALQAQPGSLLKYLPPASPTSSAQAIVRADNGERLAVYIDPYTAQVLGSLPERGTLMWTIRRLHSLDFFGPVANGLIEVAAGWSLLLVASGLYLWWPRGRKHGVINVRGTPAKRVFWRDLHAVTGLVTACFIVFLALTGMPWSLIWGAKVNQWANGNNFGYPAGVRVQVPMSGARLADGGKTTWSLEQARVPESGHEGHAGHGDHTMHAPAPASNIGLNQAVARFDQLGLAPGYAINLPNGPTGVYTGSVYPNDLQGQRVVHLDQYSGKPLINMSYADYGPAGKTLEWGINVHMGQEFGLSNQIVLALACLAIMIVGGLIFPLVGLSLIVMLILDRLFQRSKTAA